MSAPVQPQGLSEQQRAAILAQLGDAQPATDALLVEFAEQIRDRREHDHTSAGPDWDWYCLNASGWLGDRAPTVLRRLLDAEAEVERLRAVEANARKLVSAWLRASAEHISISNLDAVRDTPLMAGMQDGRANQYSDCANELRDVLDGEDPDGFEFGVSVQVTAESEDALAEREFAAEAGHATEHTDWRAWHDSDASMPLGQYTGREAAMGHVHHVLAREESVPVEEIEKRVRWQADDPHGPEDEPTVWECWLTDADGDDEKPTGYVVSPVEVAAAYDPDGDE